MSLDWKPSDHFASSARQAGFPVPGTEEFNAGLTEFRSYWLTRQDRKTQHEWDHALIKSLKADKLRRNQSASGSSPRTARPAKFDPVAYVNRNRTSQQGESNAPDSTVIDGTAERVA